MKLAPEYMIGGVLAVLVLIVILVVGVTASWVILNTKGEEPAPAPETTTTVQVEETTSTTESTTTSTSTTESTTTSTLTSTTKAPSWVCDKTLTRTETVVTRCQSQTPGASVGGRRENNNTQVTADVVYELINPVGGYSDFQAKVEGRECVYQMSSCTMKFSQLMSCEKPRNLTRITNATMKP